MALEKIAYIEKNYARPHIPREDIAKTNGELPGFDISIPANQQTIRIGEELLYLTNFNQETLFWEDLAGVVQILTDARGKIRMIMN